jgi:hypothetical protein
MREQGHVKPLRWTQMGHVESKLHGNGELHLHEERRWDGRETA